MGINLAEIIKGCKIFWGKVTAQNGLVKNTDGTISVYISNSNGILSPAQVSQQCCNVLAEITTEPYYYDLDTQKCRWSDKSSIGCIDNQPFKIVLNPKGNDGTIFNLQDDEKCSLVVDFDYLFKLDCETLSKTLSQTSNVNPALQNQIINLEQQISEQTVKCEEITSNLNYLLEQYNKTNYSITCDKFPATPVVVIGSTPIDPREQLPTDIIKPTQTQKEPFTKTGFNGGLAPFSFPSIKYISVNFCLTNDGITVWQNILGANRYEAFLGGEPLSYKCADVINIYNQNQTLLSVGGNVNPLIVECTTPFGTKSEIKHQIDNILIKQTECNDILVSLQTELDNLLTQQALVTSCDSPIGVMENLSVSMSIDIVETNGDLTTVYEYNFFPSIGAGNLYNYLVSNPTNSGFFVCGEPSVNETWATGCTPLNYPELSSQTQAETNSVEETNVSSCLMIRDYILQQLFTQSELESESIFFNSLSPTILSSAWLKYTTLIDDVDVINMIANKKIKLSLNINENCGNFCVLIDSISLTKQCVDVNSTSLFVSQSPGFNLTRVVDNKKSWLNNTSLVNREFDVKNVNGFNAIRQTDYVALDERLVINTKEIDLDMNIASAVEYDVWCYLSDNPCLLTGVTYCDPCVACGDKNFQDGDCVVFQDLNPYDFMDNTSNNIQLFSQSYCCGDNKIDFTSLFTTDLSTIKTIDNFKNLMISELINVKNRKTISGYPTLKALYERYLNSLNHCDTKSSAFDYYTMDEFANLIGDYWVDIIEQVIPATTIWGSVKIYTNTIFDQQKFKYKEYSSLFGANPFQCLNVLSPINGISGQCQSIDVITTVISVPKEGELKPKPVYNYSDKLCISQMNWGSEFIGTVSIDDGTGVQQPYANLCDVTVPL